MKFQAIYRVTVYNQDSTVIIGARGEEDSDGNLKIVQDEARLTCQFSVTRGVISGANKCNIKLYNLAPSTRDKIFQDAFQPYFENWKYVKLEAGYDGNLTQIFLGRIMQAYSHRQGGQTDIVTEIQALAYDIFDCSASYTFEAGTTYKEALQTISTGSMPNVKLENVGNLEGTFKTRTTFDGDAMENISKLTGGNAFVDNNSLNVLMSNEVIDVPVPVITEANGLLDTPDRRGANLEVKMLFEPSLIVGQLLEIKSGISPIFNGQYKVMGFTHDCTISGNDAGSRVTTVNLFYGAQLPGAEINVSGETQYNFNKVKGYEISSVNTINTQKWVKPCRGRISSPFGWRVHPITKVRTYHKGLDINAGLNTPIKAPAFGRVTFAGWDGPNGNCVRLDHGVINGKRVTSTMIHMSSICVSKGISVQQGDAIGKVGSTGRYSNGKPSSTGPHLHISVYENGSAVNPQKYIKI